MYTDKGGREAEWVYAAMGLPLLAICKAVPREPRLGNAVCCVDLRTPAEPTRRETWRTGTPEQ